MVTRLALAFLLVLTALGIQAAGIKAQLDHATIALGEPLLLTLSQPTSGSSLESIDIAPLTADFEVHARTLNRSSDTETLALTLYPLRNGRLAIPALKTASVRSSPIDVTVLAAPAGSPAVRFSLETVPAQPIQRQPTRLTLEICDDGSLTWQRPALPARAGLHIRALGEEQLNVEHDGLPCTAHRFHWALILTSAGTLNLTLPMLEAGKFGQRLRFPSPPANIGVSPVPAWLPPEAAIGRPEIRLAPLPATWPVQRPLAWRIEVVGGYSETALKTLLQLQLAHTAFNTYPPSIETLPNEDAKSPLPRLAATLTLLPQASGEFILPDLALPYFDPASQRLEALQLSPQKLTVYNPLHRQLRDFGIGLAGLAAVLLAGWQVQLRLARYLARRRSLARIDQAADLSALIAAVKAYNPQAGTRSAATLGIWQARMTAKGDQNQIRELVATLEAAHYGQATTDLDSLKRLTRAALA